MKKQWSKKEDAFLRENISKMKMKDLASSLKVTYGQVYQRVIRLRISKKIKSVVDDLISIQNKKVELSWKRKYEKSAEIIANLEDSLKASQKIDGKIKTFKIDEVSSSGDSESTAVVLLSDWHYEEDVKRSATNGLNEFNLKIADQRTNYLFQRIVKFIQIHQRETKIDNLILALLGDFISGTIHDDLMESNNLSPIEAIWKVQNIIASGIEHILNNTKLNIIIPACVGNHGRITERQRVSTENGNSLEWLMYLQLEKYFTKNKRVKFIINDGYINYIDVYKLKIRFHHGHAIKYGGGIGGIFIPAYKSISQWDKAIRADLTLFGHFHQMKDGGNFICNGSLIGYNAYAVKIKADYEKPKQAFLLIDSQRGIIVTRPIILNGNI